MSITVYHYPKCGTCRKALAWLNERGIAYTLVNLVETPPSKSKLNELWKRSGVPIRTLFNTSGESYRNGGFKEKLKNLSDADALAALAADGKLIQRPIVDLGDDVLIGFKAGEYEGAFPSIA